MAKYNPNYTIPGIVGIYKITHKPSGRCYVGQSVDIGRRWREHLGVKDNLPIHQALKVFGITEFSFEIIQVTKPERLDELEKYYIKKFDCIYPKGYNITSGGSKLNKKKAETVKGKLLEDKGVKYRPRTEKKERKGSKVRFLKPKEVQRYKWLTPEGKIVKLTKSTVSRWYPEYKLVE